jgi:hypothetical protein
MGGFSEGIKVEWDWGKGTASGEVEEVHTQKRTLEIDGSEVTREASEDCPAYRIKQSDGQTVMKSHSQVCRGS